MVSLMQPALLSVKELLGNSGYRCYADSLNRHHVTFHLAISDASSRISALVNLTCDLMRAAKDVGCDTKKLLEDAKTASFVSFDERTGLQYALENTIGADAVSVLSNTIPMARRDVSHALRSVNARHYPHFRLIATTALALKMQGVSVKRVILDRVDRAPANTVEGESD